MGIDEAIEVLQQLAEELNTLQEALDKLQEAAGLLDDIHWPDAIHMPHMMTDNLWDAANDIENRISSINEKLDRID